MLRLYRRIDDNLEYCFNVKAARRLSGEELERLKLILAEGFIASTVSEEPRLETSVEVGPRLNFATAWSSNIVSIFKAVGLGQITRLERSRRLVLPSSVDPNFFIAASHDRMTEQVYGQPLATFDTGIKPQPLAIVPLLENGPDELKKIAIAAFDDFERRLIYDYFANQEKRNPTMAEILDWANANSEHCRHWLFRAKWVIDQHEMAATLFDLVKKPWLKNPGPVLFAFDDNGGAIRGQSSFLLTPASAGGPSFCQIVPVVLHLTSTAETHNFPTGVSPNGGAQTCLGRMQRDQRDIRRGAVILANVAGYAVANLNLPGYKLPWEKSKAYLPSLASPLSVMIDGTNGMHRYGNESGVPLICGFVRSTDITIAGERWAFQKPIFYGGGIGTIREKHTPNIEPEKGMLIIEIGGPAYRIGKGGGAASSKGQGDQALELDFNAVQRGNAERSRTVDRVLYSCVCRGEDNPIVKAHDQGAGGVANATKEAVGKAGGKIDIRQVNVGDPTMSVDEIYVCEFQERECVLIWPDRLEEFLAICEREKCPCEILGEITGDGRFTVIDSFDGSTPVSLDLASVIGELPQKTYYDERKKIVFPPLDFSDIDPNEAIDRVLRLPSVASKRFLVKNVDRSVKGLTARQQCCGPLQLTVADCGISALSHFGFGGAAVALGEKSFLMLGDPAAGARMAVAEAILNLAGAPIGELGGISFRANWMWAPKLPGEGAALYDAAQALSDILVELEININGGKDSSSMFSRIDGQVVKSPRELVMKAVASVYDIRRHVTPDFKGSGNAILFLDLAKGHRRLGGSALAQVYGQIGRDFPDVVDASLIKNGFAFMQKLLEKDWLLSCHDVSDGGLITALLEMAIAGDIGFTANILGRVNSLFARLFAEELGIILEVDQKLFNDIVDLASELGLENDLSWLGETSQDKIISIQQGDWFDFRRNLSDVRSAWEMTSYHLDRQRTNHPQAEEEWESVRRGDTVPIYQVNFDFAATLPEIMEREERPKMAVLREEGTNGEDEMRSAFYLAGFDVADITMTDLLEGRTTLDQFQGLAAAGGFSYADVPDSAKGWAATIRFNENLSKMFQKFYLRPDTFSLGVCNGCQLFGLLGWVPWAGIKDEDQPRFVHNLSGIFESRWSSVKVLPSPSIMLKGMEGSTLGVWVAHGEGRLIFPCRQIRNRAVIDNLIPLAFVNSSNEKTESYPANPNGSFSGFTALTTPDGRHLAMMPHPERCFRKWQWAYLPEHLKKEWGDTSPWLKMFQNARQWCDKNK